MAWTELRDPKTNRLLLRFDPETLLVEDELVYWDRATRQRISRVVVLSLAPLLAHLMTPCAPDPPSVPPPL